MQNEWSVCCVDNIKVVDLMPGRCGLLDSTMR